MLDGYKQYRGKFLAYQPFPKGKDRKAWDDIQNKPLGDAIKQASSHDLVNWEPLPFTQWLSFSRTGNRVDYEQLYFGRRMKLCDLVIAECAQYKGEYIDGILGGIVAICEESAWQLPAHNRVVRDGPVMPMADMSTPILDLFACETGALLATTYYLLEEELEVASPGLEKRIRYELNRRIIRPYLEEWFWWMGGKGEKTLNWTVWCTQNVLLTAFLFDFSEEIRKSVFRKSIDSVEYFLEDYGEDGCCDEGAGYYRHAGLCLFGCLNVLDSVVKRSKVSDSVFNICESEKSSDSVSDICESEKLSDSVSDICESEKLSGSVSDICESEMLSDSVSSICESRMLSDNVTNIWKQEKIKNIAGYIMNVHVEDKYYINYGDCSPLPGRAGVREYLFGKKLEDVMLCSFAATDSRRDDFDISGRDLPLNANLFYRVQEICTLEELHNYNDVPVVIEDIYYPSTGLFIARDDRFTLAVKAGNNGENHNHNDTGSVILFKDGNPLLIDLGVENYTAKTFSKDRYEIWTMQSSWHNLADFDGAMEEAGEEYGATEVKVKLDEGKTSAKIGPFKECGVFAETELFKELEDISVEIEPSEEWKEVSIEMELSTAWKKEAPIDSYKRMVTMKKNKSITIHDQCRGSYKEAYLNLLFAYEPRLEEDNIILEGFAKLKLGGAKKVEIEEVRITDSRLKKAWQESIFRVRIGFDEEILVSINNDAIMKPKE